MFNRNSFKTSLIFLGIIFFAVMLRMFLVEDSLFVKSESNTEIANVVCTLEGFC